jgi:hypothetical protein
MRRLTALLAVVVALTLTAPAQSITFGQPDGNRHPNVGALVVKLDDGTLIPWCSGTMVSERVFLTAAHCKFFADLSFGSGYEFGVTFISDLGIDDPVPNLDESDLVMGVAHAHPSYTGKYGNGASGIDVGVVVLEADPGVGQSDLPAPGLLDTINLKTAAFTTVGYGAVRNDKTTGPHSITFDGVRRFAVQTASQLSNYWLKFSGNPSTGNGGTCGGDSGGPHFLGAGAEETDTVVSVTIKGDTYCRSTDWTARVDTPEALSFIRSFID